MGAHKSKLLRIRCDFCESQGHKIVKYTKLESVGHVWVPGTVNLVCIDFDGSVRYREWTMAVYPGISYMERSLQKEDHMGVLISGSKMLARAI